jgi:protein deglycase
MPATLILIADGTEEMEAVIVIDVLRRAGWPVTVAAVGEGRIITASRGVQLVADVSLQECDTATFDVLILPGGKGGTDVFTRDKGVQETLRAFDRDGRSIAAICAAPLALDAAGILRNRRYTCYPGMEREIGQGKHCRATVVHDDNLTTSQGPGTAFAFALALVAQFESKMAAEKLRRQMVIPRTGWLFARL